MYDLCVTLQSLKAVRSKIDHSDPNPAHKLKRSLEELTLTRGKNINPRFTDTKHKSKIPRCYSSADLLRKIEPTKLDSRRLRKSITLGELESTDTTPRSFLNELSQVKEDPSEEEMAAAILTNGHHRRSLHSKPSPILESIEEDDIEVSNTETETTVFLKNILSRGSLKNEVSKDSNSVEHIEDIEVNSTENETTVYLQQILREGDNPSLTSVDEEDLPYYEVPDKDSELIMASWRNFPHGIPRVCVFDETGELLEVIVDPPQRTPEDPPQSRESWNTEPITKL